MASESPPAAADNAAASSQWAWGNVWQSAKSAAEELSKKVADSAPQWQQTAENMMQNLGIAQNQVPPLVCWE